MEEKVAQDILAQVTSIATQVNAMQLGMNNMQENMNTMQENMNTMQENMNTMQENMNTMQDSINTLQGTVSVMQSQITDLSIGQVKLSEKIDRVEQNLRTELKAEINGVRTELVAEILEVREIAEFTKETCETIINTLDREYKVNNANIKVVNIANMENKKYILDHEKRICILENKKHHKKAIPLV